MPSFPIKTAAVLIPAICSSKRRCQGNPGRNSHSSSQGNSPRSLQLLADLLYGRFVHRMMAEEHIKVIGGYFTLER